MTLNPFLCETYEKLWLKYFAENRPVHRFPMFKDLGFIKKRLIPVFYNLGGTQTKGVNYPMLGNHPLEGQNKVFVIYDVPSSSIPDTQALSSNRLKIRVSEQYAGYLCNFKGYSTLDSYLRDSLSSRSRAKLRNYGRKWERVPDITYKMHLSETSRDTYDNLFKSFRVLMDKRFSQKKEYNNNLRGVEWDFYQEVTYPLMMENKAGLFVTYKNDSPIAITLLFKKGAKLIDTMRVFDISYAKYRIGTLSTLEMLKWCFNHKIEVLDFSKGYYEYKDRWGNNSYRFNYHIIYDPGSLIAVILANILHGQYELKQILRGMKLNLYFNRLKYYLQSKK